MRGYLLFATMLASAPALAADDIQPNSRPFQLDDAYLIDANGDVQPYRAAGFAQPASPGYSPKLFLLPVFSVRPQGVRFYAANGQSFDPAIYRDRTATAISITLRASSALPTQAELPLIASALKGVKQPYLYPPIATAPGGQPLIYGPAQTSPAVLAAIQSSAKSYADQLAVQTALGAEYASYRPQQTALNELSIALLIDGEVVAERSLKGTAMVYGGDLPPVTLVQPTEFQRNRIADGDYELQVHYRFRDSHTASVAAHFDAKQVMDNFVEETQDAITKKKSSGWQVFNIGSRRSKMSQSLNQQVNASYKEQKLEGTVVVMDEATEDQVDLFEARFMPEASKDDVIERHERAAEEARAAGRPDLAKVHQDYADALKGSDELKEVDAVAAAAALNRGDYASFIAQGVRFSQRNDRMTNHFRRAITAHAEIEQAKDWIDVRNVAAQRDTSVPVALPRPIKARGRLGICGGYDMTYPVPGPFGYPPQQRHGLLITCVQENSPALKAGLMPGMIVTALDGETVTSLQKVEDRINTHDPGDYLSVDVWQAPAGSDANYQVKLTRGMPVPADEA